MTYYSTSKTVGEQIQIGPHVFHGGTARLIMNLGAPVFTKMTHIAHLAQMTLDERRAISAKMIEAGHRLGDSKKRFSHAEALVATSASSAHEANEYAKELASAKVQLELVQANYDALASRAAKIDDAAPQVFERCKKALLPLLGGAGQEVFRTMGWD